MTVKTLKKSFIIVLTIIAAICVAAGFFTGKLSAAADEEAALTEYKITSVSGGWQENNSRYVVWLESDSPFDCKTNPLPKVTVSIDGKDKEVEVLNDTSGKQLALIIYKAEVPKDTRVAVIVRKGTVFGNYRIAEDFTVILKYGAVEPEPKAMTFTLQRDDLDDITSCIQETEDLHRYLIRIQTDIDGITDTMWRDGDVCVFDEGTEKEKKVPVHYLGGMAGKDSPSYDGTAILGVINYADIIDGATVSSEIGKHSVTIKKGTEFGGGYVLAEDFTFYIGNEYIAENDYDIPELPSGVLLPAKGLENKTIELNPVKIEDYIADSSVVKLKANAEKDADGNVLLKSGDPHGFCKSIKMVGSKAEPQIKFRSVYNGGDVYLVYELRSQFDNGNFWLTTGAPTVRMRYNGKQAEDSEKSQCLWFDFFHNGLEGSPQFVIYNNDEFKLEQDEYFVEFGAVNKEDTSGNDGFVFYVKVTQGEKVAYGECLMSGDYNVSESGDVSIYISPFATSLLTDLTKWEGGQVVKDSLIMSVDSERTIDGKTVKIGAMSLYNPKIRRAENTKVYDISDLVPIGDGITYTKVENDVTSASQSLVNATDVPTNNGGYSVKAKIKFSGADFGATFAFRGKNTLAKTGYKLIIADDVVIIGSMTKPSPFKPDTEYDIEIGCVDYYIGEESVSSGTIVYLKVDGELVVEDNIDKLSALGTYFCGIIEGAGGSSVTISSAKNAGDRKAIEIVTKSNKTTLSAGKKATLSYSTNMETAYSTITYEVVKGAAHISGDGLYADGDGEIVVKVKIENEYGVFYGSELKINEGVKGDDSESSGKKKGCKGGVSATMTLPLFAAAIISLGKKRRETK